MKVLSVIVPSYNSESYLSKCIHTLLDSGEGIEILIVNDGSTDGTAHMADAYASSYPDKIRAIHQRNLGHGGAVNTGIAHATGKYIKVVDSDDWVNPEALQTVVSQLKGFVINCKKVDMILANFMYDKVGETQKKIMHYKGTIPENQIIGWSDIGKFKPGKYILMHSVIYSLEVLKKSGLKLPEHTFYVDNLFVYQPLPYVEKLFYMNLCVYHYFIGREDQSVNEKNMMRRIDQQLRVNALMLESTVLHTVKDKTRRHYMMHYLAIVTTVSSIILLRMGTTEAIKQKKALWRSIKQYDYTLYLNMRLSLIGNLINLPGTIGRKISLLLYKIARRRVGFN